jgi:hypothetical protein
MNKQAEQMLVFQLRRLNTNLFKRFLEINDRLSEEHNETISKLKAHLPTQYHKDVDLANSFTDNKKEIIRKEVLGAGNDTYRGIMAELEQFDIDFRK